jgi:hypothetical protein
MEAFAEIALPGGGSLIVEATGDDAVVQAGRGRRVGEMVEESFESAIDRVTLAAHAVREKVMAMEPAPDEVTVEFAIKLATEVGVVVANTTAEANLKLVMRWGPAGE